MIGVQRSHDRDVDDGGLTSHEGAGRKTGSGGGSEFAIVAHGKRVALAGIAALEPAAEPALPLLARAVRELPLIRMAEGVIPDRVRGGERFPQILVRDLERRSRRMTPDAGKAVGLELHAHRRLV